MTSIPLPETTYILDAYKEFMIQNMDPVEMCPTDLTRSLEFKEKIISMYTPEFLAENIENYKELEDEAALDPENFNMIRLLKGLKMTTQD